MRLTIGICTWNRARLLDLTLQSMGRLEIPPDVAWELIIVNNCCTDETEAVIERHRGRLPLRRLHEPRPGKSLALNTATAAAQGDWILWTDDDVLVDPQWAVQFVRAAELLPRAAFFGGTIEPWFETAPPHWLTKAWPRLAAVYATRTPGDQAKPIGRDYLPYGANFAIRADVQRQFPYDSRLGRVGASEVRGEETTLVEQLLQAGLCGYWVPAAKVRHFIPPERLTLDFVQRFFFGIGQTASLRTSGGSAPLSRWWPRASIWTKVLLNQAKYRLARPLLPPDDWIKYLQKSSYYRGRLAAGSTVRTARSVRAA